MVPRCFQWVPLPRRGTPETIEPKFQTTAANFRAIEPAANQLTRTKKQAAPNTGQPPSASWQPLRTSQQRLVTFKQPPRQRNNRSSRSSNWFGHRNNRLERSNNRRGGPNNRLERSNNRFCGKTMAKGWQTIAICAQTMAEGWQTIANDVQTMAAAEKQ
jgi:hypothetical protein